MDIAKINSLIDIYRIDYSVFKKKFLSNFSVFRWNNRIKYERLMVKIQGFKVTTLQITGGQ